MRPRVALVHHQHPSQLLQHCTEPKHRGLVPCQVTQTKTKHFSQSEFIPQPSVYGCVAHPASPLNCETSDLDDLMLPSKGSDAAHSARARPPPRRAQTSAALP